LARFLYRAAVFVAYAFAILLLLSTGVAISSYSQYSADHECPKEYFPFSLCVLSFVWIWIGEHIDSVAAGFSALATIFIAWFTFALFSATRQLKESTDKLWEAGERQVGVARDAAEAARRSADAADAQAKAAGDAVKIANRPWVFTQPWPVTADATPNGDILFEMELFCYGNAPAVVTKLCVECSASPPSGDSPHYTVEPVPKNIGLAPGNRWLEKDSSGAFFKTTTERPYVFGFVRYMDQFGTHTSGYSVRLSTHAEKPRVTLVTAGTPAWSRFD